MRRWLRYTNSSHSRHTPGTSLSTWVAIPAFVGLIIFRWSELEHIAALIGHDLAALRIADLSRLRYPPDPISSAKPAESSESQQQLALSLAVLEPAPILDERLTTTQQARELRDVHPGRRAGVISNGQLVRLLTVEPLSTTPTSKGVEAPFLMPRAQVEATHPSSGSLVLAPPALEELGAVWQPRRLEAATPKAAQIGRWSEVWVKLPLAASPGLRAELPAPTAAGDLISVDRLRHTETEIRFKDGVEEIAVFIELVAPDFKVPQSQFALQIRRTRDSTTLKFQLEPTRERLAAPISLHISQNAQTRATIAALTLYIDAMAADRPQALGGLPSNWQVLEAPVFPILNRPVDGIHQIPQIIFVSGSVVMGDQITVGDVTDSNTVAIGTAAQASMARDLPRDQA